MSCEIAVPEKHDLPCGAASPVVVLDVYHSEKLGLPKTISLCERHYEFLKDTQMFGEITLLGYTERRRTTVELNWTFRRSPGPHIYVRRGDRS